VACFPAGEAAADDAILLKAGLESAIWRKMPASFCFMAERHCASWAFPTKMAALTISYLTYARALFVLQTVRL
jgi:hypothetical protein